VQTSALCIFYNFIFWIFFDGFQWGVWTPKPPLATPLIIGFLSGWLGFNGAFNTLGLFRLYRAFRIITCHTSCYLGRIAVTLMRPIVTNRVVRSVCMSVGRSVAVVTPAKTAEPIEMPFVLRLRTRVGPRKHVLGGDEHWQHLLNTTKPSMCGGDAAFCQITLTTCL